MSVTNQEIGDVLEALALLMEVDGAQGFRVRAYRVGAEQIVAQPEPVADRVAAGEDLTALQGVGKGIAGKVAEIVSLGPAAYLARLEQDYAPGLLALLRVPGLGPKRVRAIRDGLGTCALEAVRDAALAGELRVLEGLGEKSEATILASVRRALGDEG